MTLDQTTSRRDLDILMADLEVRAVRLTECSVSRGSQLAFPPIDKPSIFYVCTGTGQVTIGNGSPIPFQRHTVFIAPPGNAIRVDVTDETGGEDCESAAVLICGCFRACFGVSIPLFAGLPCAIVEQFAGTDEFGPRLKAALVELNTQHIGMRAMTAALVKQVLITLLRRSLSSAGQWPGWFVMLRDPQVARAFADMCSRPHAPHSVRTLSRTAGLSRSAFMMRFATLFGISPAAALRQLRMRYAAKMMSRGSLSIKQLAHAVGYVSPSSFVRAFRQTYGHAPLDHRAMARELFKHESWPPEPDQHGEGLRSGTRRCWITPPAVASYTDGSQP